MEKTHNQVTGISQRPESADTAKNLTIDGPDSAIQKKHYNRGTGFSLTIEGPDSADTEKAS
jgi:hypothetical protein